MFMSILIPTWNRDKTVLRAVDSVGCEGYDDIEIIIVDNNSRQEVFNELQTLLSNHHNVVLLRNDSNIGMVRNWNRCIATSKGQWMGLMCSDDLYEVDAVKRMYNLAKQTDRPSLIIQDPFIKSELKHCNPGKDTAAALTLPLASGNFWHREIIETLGPFDERFEYSADAEFWPRIATKFPVIKVKQTNAVYLRNQTSYMWSTWRKDDFLEQTELLIRTGIHYTTDDKSETVIESIVRKGIGATIDHIIESTIFRANKIDLFKKYFMIGLRKNTGILPKLMYCARVFVLGLKQFFLKVKSIIRFALKRC